MFAPFGNVLLFALFKGLAFGLGNDVLAALVAVGDVAQVELVVGS